MTELVQLGGVPNVTPLALIQDPALNALAALKAMHHHWLLTRYKRQLPEMPREYLSVEASVRSSLTSAALIMRTPLALALSRMPHSLFTLALSRKLRVPLQKQPFRNCPSGHAANIF